MALVTTCTTCGLVNGDGGTCEHCGSELSSLRFRRSHLEPGMRESIGRITPRVGDRRIGGLTVVTPEREVFVIRRRWLDRTLHLPMPVTWEQVSDDVIDQGPWVGTMRAAALFSGLLAVLAYPVLFAVELIVSAVRLIDWMGGSLFEVFGKFVFRRPWTVEVYRGRMPVLERALHVRGYRRTADVIDELSLAFRLGDTQFLPAEAMEA